MGSPNQVTRSLRFGRLPLLEYTAATDLMHSLVDLVFVLTAVSWWEVENSARERDLIFGPAPDPGHSGNVRNA